MDSGSILAKLRFALAAKPGPALQPGHEARKSRLIRLVAGHGAPERFKFAPVGFQANALTKSWFVTGVDRPGRRVEKCSETGAEYSASAISKTSHWSFQPIGRPNPPSVRDEKWVRNPIDRFILARLEAEGVAPSPEADKYTLIRRLSLDLTGLPPSPQEVDAFISDNRPDAYERLVDSLLASPHYGEKWARHWLDLARYADSDGYEKDEVRPHAWRYRQWVIDSLKTTNLSGPVHGRANCRGPASHTLLSNKRSQRGFQRNAVTNREDGIDVEQFRAEKMVDRTATFGTVWLGLTVGCAQCHDHKYDPIKQRDFYRLLAFFNNEEEVDIEAPLAGEMGPYLAALPEYRAKRKALLERYNVPALQPAWEQRMKEARANPGKWTDWDKAYTVFVVQLHLDDADKILDTEPAKRTEEQADLLTDHFVINYYRVNSKERNAELTNFRNSDKQLDALKAMFPALSARLRRWPKIACAARPGSRFEATIGRTVLKYSQALQSSCTRCRMTLHLRV